MSVTFLPLWPSWCRWVWAAGLALLVPPVLLAGGNRPVRVKIIEEKTEVQEEANLPLDPINRCQLQFTGQMAYGLTVDNKQLTFSAGGARTTFKIDNQIIYPNVGVTQPLPPGPQKKVRHGGMSSFNHGTLRLTQICEVVPGRPPGKPQPGQKCHLNTVLIRYLVENNGDRPREVGIRMRMDTYNVDNDGCLFAAPNKPNQILDGVTLQGKEVPDYLMSLQRPNLQAAGNVAYFTLRLGHRISGPTRVCPTSHGAGENGWDVQVIRAGGDSDLVLYWDPVAIPPKSKREFGYAYGLGLASSPENEGRVNIVLGGSFEPGKLFTIRAYVDEPVDSQNLTLELPPGLNRVEGRATQPVPAPNSEGVSLVMWKGTVERPGTYQVRIRSSNGTTHTRTVIIEENR